MFDEQDQPATEAPPVFDGTTDTHLPDRSPETTVMGPSALEAGKLTPKQTDPVSMQGMDSGELHEPTALKRIILATVIVAVIAIIAGGVWWFLNRTDSTNAPAAAEKKDEPVPPASASIDVDTPPAVPTAPSAEGVEFQQPQPTEPAPAPEPPKNVDTDKDGLTDAREAQLKTDPNNPDTDGDSLNDGAEVNIWGTDPFKKDTDSDGFPDGQEVMNGFNPKGAGKLQ